ncbi:putative Peptidase M48, Ste24p [Thiomonas arsenitoxydans]|uniref:Peptidase M48, Ste24p n=1 Tax=Thiomonas arsenitoxydans (strain DSM 22701 / CIP 110005 / 3As) TaxID=426114 RepID=D6CPF5_THIA3|nr:M48 family metallopeptidase [Thiomonas arsenitoxydans]CAZ87885.1 putative Peptidase M48, Ste24p [Thiomonas arsenitoxydans]CQR26585.1 putative Peptidase M48, Ste24p [Thiomonas arsenitoxydans]CQR27337.1 putative Peptidase M48, Ste24p [Thiomonas arsenitoxydans]CQR31256.1 putative Peptidase M48, Ste24p [Thiomonas arsenitoxydans]CQR31269.1 putative Peptidase M48, Ste24p [Thiomonas arsenitoxydans]
MSPQHLALAWSALFAAALIGGTALKLWLAQRQQRHVLAHRDAVPAPFRASISLEAHQKAADYTVAKLRFGLWTTLFSAMIVLVWTLEGGLQLLNGWVSATFGTALGGQLALLVAFAVIGSLLDLPWEVARTFGLESRFGFNRLTPRMFVVDLLKNALVGAVLMLPLALLVLWIMQVAGGWWWLWAWAGLTAFSLLMMVAYPLVIAPLFNKFQPLPDGEVKTRAQALMQRCDFALSGLFVMDGSRRSAHANAYFTGMGAARRVVLFDTLLGQLSPAQIEGVLAHEVGHYKRHHILKRMAVMFGISLAGFALLGWLSNQVWFYVGLGVMPNLFAPNHALALILFSLALPVFAVFFSPLGAATSRKHEFEADAYAAQHSDARALGEALVTLYRDNASTLTPDPVYVRFYYSHPPALQRLERLGALPSSIAPSSAHTPATA